MQVGSFLGIWFGGWLIYRKHVPMGFVINGLSFLASAMSLTIVTKGRKPSAVSSKQTRILNDWREILQHFFREKKLLAASFIASADFVLPQAFNILLAPLVFYRFSDDPFWLSTLDSCFAAGAGAAGIFAGHFIHKKGIQVSSVLGFSLQAFSLLALALVTTKAQIIFAILLFGTANTLSWTSWQTWIQTHVKKAHRGRFSLVRHLINSLMTAACALLIGTVISSSLRQTIILASIFAFVSLIGSCLFFYETKEHQIEDQISSF